MTTDEPVFTLTPERWGIAELLTFKHEHPEEWRAMQDERRAREVYDAIVAQPSRWSRVMRTVERMFGVRRTAGRTPAVFIDGKRLLRCQRCAFMHLEDERCACSLYTCLEEQADRLDRVFEQEPAARYIPFRVNGQMVQQQRAILSFTDRGGRLNEPEVFRLVPVAEPESEFDSRQDEGADDDR